MREEEKEERRMEINLVKSEKSVSEERCVMLWRDAIQHEVERM